MQMFRYPTHDLIKVGERNFRFSHQVCTPQVMMLGVVAQDMQYRWQKTRPIIVVIGEQERRVAFRDAEAGNWLLPLTVRNSG
jgi:hypothetical protein